jgi:very-short-patch-repair endonuclease
VSVLPGLDHFDGQVLAWLRTHHATVSSAVLEAAGVSIDQRERLVQRGVLQRVVRGAYHHTVTELDELGRCAAVCTARSELIICGPTAARIWRLRRAGSDQRVHVLAPPGSQPCRADWLIPYRTPLTFADDVVVRPDGIRLTSPPRTVVDMARFLADEGLASMTEHAIALRYCTPATLRRTADRMDTRGRPWVRRFLRVLDARHPGPASESEPELRVYTALRSRGVDDLRRQHQLMLRGYGRARFDMAIPELMWALEVDVHPEHRTIEGLARDRRRDEAAEEIGWAVRRLVEVELAAFDAAIDSALGSIRRRRDSIAGRSDVGGLR